MSDGFRQAILRTLAFHETWQYAPTFSELVNTLDTAGRIMDREEINGALQELEREHRIRLFRGRWGIASSVEEIVQELERRDRFQARKLRRARLVARALVRLRGVRFVALANTTALGAARDFGDLDFFIIVRDGSIWTNRFISAAAAKLFGVQPRGDEIRDAVCFSYFISDAELNLVSHQLAHDDPYYRYWFLSLLLLADDGVGQALWDANRDIRARHPFAEPWRVSPDLRIQIPMFRFPTFSFVESLVRWFQLGRLPKAVQELQNRDSRVMVTDAVLKFHVEDARAAFRETYRARAKELKFEL
ncbi:hypothetical protein KBC59_04605 [Patescibacteria group bacterium]|nr:hypothetical protein [Patescibacteria group bacterium]